MDLQISVFLLLVFFTAGHSLSCYECMDQTGSCASQKVKTCPSGFSECVTSTAVQEVGDISIKAKVKDCSADCQSSSMNVGLVKMSSVCCNTDRCNVQDPSDSPNGKECYSCDLKSCSNILSCSGSQDRCLKATLSIGGQSLVLKGCVSKSICEAATSVGGVQGISCCSGNLCNGAQRVTQSFLFLCCSLLSFILLH